MRIIVNGREEEAPEGANVSNIIALFENPVESLIVVMNGCFLYPHEYETTIVEPEAMIELYHPVFGG